MKKEIINAQGAPAAVGPYSHAVKAGDLVFTSGQCGFIPETGALPEGIEAQARQALTNLKCVLEGSGCTMKDVVKTAVFLADINDFGLVNGIYAEYFTSEEPARSCVQVAKLPKGALIEVEAVAVCRS